MEGEGQGDCTISHDPSSTFSRYSVFQAAVSRLFFIPTFAVFSFLSRLKAVRRRILKLASAFPFLIRHWSRAIAPRYVICDNWDVRFVVYIR